MVDAKVHDHILKLLNSQRWEIKYWTYRLVERLAGHEHTVPAILELNLFKQLVVLAR